jgi:hydroxyethylthiazole kinase-like sugar kinase family protein
MSEHPRKGVLPITYAEALVIADGNHGVISILPRCPHDILQTIHGAGCLKGATLWVFYSDVCGKDFDRMRDVLSRVSASEIAEICNDNPNDVGAMRRNINTALGSQGLGNSL